MDSVDIGELYEATRGRFAATVRGCTSEQLLLLTPASPAWRVRDVLAHVVGLASDLNAQRFPAPDDPGGERWGAAQVEFRSSHRVAALLAEWDREAPTFAAGLTLFGYDFGNHFVADLHAHHQDIRNALGLSRDDDRRTVAASLDHYLAFVGEVLDAAGWGRLTVEIDGRTRTVGGAGPHEAHVRAEAFELLRCLSARRSKRQVLALDWTGDAVDLLDVLERGLATTYSFRAEDLDE